MRKNGEIDVVIKDGGGVDMVNMNEVLFGLTYRGYDKYPIPKSKFMELLSSFGFNEDYNCENALEMLQLLGHVDYVVRKGTANGLYRLNPPHLRPRFHGGFTLAGARSPDIIESMNVKRDLGIRWRINYFEIEQPDVLTLSDENLGDISEDIARVLYINDGKWCGQNWHLPQGNLPTWEALAMQNLERLTVHPIRQYRDERNKMFIPGSNKWIPVHQLSFIFKNTGPLYLIRSPTIKHDVFIIVIKRYDGGFMACKLPHGLSHLRWARLMVMSSYGIPAVEYNSEIKIIESNIWARLPLSLERALVDITGKVPIRDFNKQKYTFLGVEPAIAENIIQMTTESFVKTRLFNEFMEGKT
jgi:hypothetical protein